MAFSKQPTTLSLPKSGLYAFPDSPLVKEALAEVVPALPASIANHSLRSFILGQGYAGRHGKRFDAEAFFIACLYHDLGLMHPRPGQPFTEQSARLCGHCLTEQKVEPARIGLILDAIRYHMQLMPPWHKSIEAGLLQIAAYMDVTFLRRWELWSLAARAEKDFPRLNFQFDFNRLLAGSLHDWPSCSGLLLPAEPAEQSWPTGQSLKTDKAGPATAATTTAKPSAQKRKADQTNYLITDDACFHHVLQGRPRVADLDTQRHVTSRTYEHFSFESRLALLGEQGYPASRLLEEGIRLVPLAGHVKFFREQQPGALIEVQTGAWPAENGSTYWLHRVMSVDEASGERTLACRIVSQTRAEQKGQPVSLLKGKPLIQSEKDIAELVENNIDLSPLTPFSNQCRRISSPFTMLYSERTPFYDTPQSALWRIFEEGRWHFGTLTGLTEEKIHEMDTVTFFTGASFQYNEVPPAGQSLEVHTWIERVDKIRSFLRQEVTLRGDSRVLLAIREEQLIVSLSKRRPRRAPAEWTEMMGEYMEFK